MGTLVRIDRTGHTELATWSPADAAATSAAEQVFNRVMAAEKPLAYDPGRSVALKTFDPQAETIILTPQLVGG